MDFRETLRNGKYIFFDGGMGTMLQAVGLQAGEKPEDWNLSRRSDIRAVHEAYIAAGADVITTNTFGANSRKYGSGVDAIITAAIQIAREAEPKFVAQDIGPTGAMLKPLGDFEFDDAYELFKEQVLVGVREGVDLFIIETMTDLLEAKAALLAVKENSDIPVVVSLSYEATGRTFLGASAAAATVILCALGADAVGVNCSLGPGELGAIVEEICKYSTVPVLVQANAGLPKSVDGRTVYDLSPEEYSSQVADILKKCKDSNLDKVQILGGCCGTNPEYIKCLRGIACEDGSLRSGPEYHFGENDVTQHAMVCSSSMLIDYDKKTAVVGERLNPTGKKKISAALRAGDFDLLVAEGLTEYECGAEILDVNAGLPDINEADTLVRLITELQGACPLPLQIDTTDVGALEAAVRHYNGKPIINSVNGKEENMAAVLPIAAKYGAAVICLTLDESGIPSKAEDRIAIARKIMERAAEYGIPKQNLIIDGLVMTVSTNQAEAVETLKTVRMAREVLGLHTCLGVSNISFGLPNREVLNAAFLAEAFCSGLNLPILDPTKDRYMQTVYSHRVLSGEDAGATNYIDYAVRNPVSAPKTAQGGSASGQNEKSALVAALGGAADNAAGTNAADSKPANDKTAGTKAAEAGGAKTIADFVVAGNKFGVEKLTRELLGERPALEIINDDFIPALDLVGQLYEQGKIFLPQLMSAAEAAKRGFDIIKENVPQSSENKRMKVVIATVKGDIHDIGKNIVRMLLENYGFDVVDLGKDVEPQLIVDAVRKDNVRLVGLSALMTTTVHNMEETIKLIRSECPDCRIVVGGAVLTKELAEHIGADFYAKDAAETTRIATEIENGRL